ncbi:MAG: tetratricopeptide repeat protein, partial [Bryobacteraceae bacterium]
MPEGAHQCVCGADLDVPHLARETTLLLSIGILVLLFVVTGFTARFYHQEQRSLARQWYSAGQAALDKGDTETAINHFRTALVYLPEDDNYELHLAEALFAGGHDNEARTYLLTLADRKPGDATVNLVLARLYAQQSDVVAASRYYTSAIYGVWEDNPQEERRAARIEFSQYLMKNGQKGEAQAELIAMASALPPDAAEHLRAADLLLAAGTDTRALAEYKTAIQLNGKLSAAWLGAGVAAFHLGDYAQAARNLERAARGGPLDAESGRLLATARDVTVLDPYAVELRPLERSRRVSRAFDLAMARFQNCAQAKGTTLAADDPPT